jgi:broad specificity phosphatase PhoE
MYALYVTHPQVTIDPEAPVPHWRLSALGRGRAERFARHPMALGLRRIVSSTETKARELADILAKVSRASVESGDKFGENDRSSTGFVPAERFEALVDAFFAYPGESVEGWETAEAAQARIVGAVEAALRTHDGKEAIGFAGHGAVGTLLKCHLGGLAIARSEDQRRIGDPGGGNLFVFRLSDRALLTDWMPMERLPEAFRV